MLIYLFRDESDNDIFAFSIAATGANIPALTPHTEWIFLEAFDTLKFPAPWDITDFQEVLDHLKADGNRHRSVRPFIFTGVLERLDMTARLFCETTTCSTSRFQTLTSFRPKQPGRNIYNRKVIGMA